VYDRVAMNHKHLASMVGLIAAGLAAGCGSSQMSRIDRHRDIYETWPIDVKQAVLDGKVEPGMTPDMVIVAWGEPTQIVTQSNSGDEIWVYESGGHPGSVHVLGGGGYPGGAYPGGGYPGGGYPGGGAPGIGIQTGSGGTSIGTGGGIGMGSSGIGMGGMPGTAIVTPARPPDVKEVVFRNGIVHRADEPN
jgi:hypothetical protein